LNKKFLEHYTTTEPKTTEHKYIFLADNENIAMNIVVCGYLAITLMPDNDACYAIDSFLKNGLECPKCSIVTKMIK